MRHRRGGILCLLYKSERDLTPTHNYLTPPHSYSPNVFERHLIFVKASSNFCSGRHLTGDIFPGLLARHFEKRLSGTHQVSQETTKNNN